MVRCDPCDRWFVDALALEQHRENHRAHYRHICDVCHKIFRLEESLNQHKGALDHYLLSCPLCGQLFRDQSALEQHLDSPKHSVSCDYCYNKRFRTEQQLSIHYETEHGYCDKCDRRFIDGQALQNHLENSSKHIDVYRCIECDRSFVDDNGLQNHLENSSKHIDVYRCIECDRSFVDDNALQNHLENSSKHIDEYRCIECDRSFVSSRALADHLQYKVHTPRPIVVVKENYCDDCERQFCNRQAFEQHRASLRHNPISEHLECPFGCDKEFLAPSALVHHLESGGCESKMTKQKIDEAAYTTDTAGIITNSGTAGLPDSVDADARSEISSETDADTGSSRLSSAKNTMLIATKRGNTANSIPSSFLELILERGLFLCPLCPERGPFIDERALKQHLASPAAHSPRLYHCPIKLPGLAGGGHRKEFTTLSGLAQHIEARACKGGRRTLKAALGEVMGVLRRTGWGFVKLVG